MLVLSRKTSESIVLPTLGVTIQVVAIKGNHVRIGISAPPEVDILREELLSERAALAAAPAKPSRELCPA